MGKTDFVLTKINGLLEDVSQKLKYET